MKPITENAGDPEKVKEAEKREKFRADIEREDLQWVLSDRRGRRFFWRLLGECRIYDTSFEPHVKDSKTIFNEGIRNVGLFLMKDLMQNSPESWLLMQQESEGESNV